MDKSPIIVFALAISLVLPAGAEERSKSAPAGEPPAGDTKASMSAASKAGKWEEPAEPIRIGGPLYFVGTRGLGVYLFATPEGHILMNTGMPSSGPMIVESIRKLGFKPEDIRIMINSHAHFDHSGAFAYLKEMFGLRLAVMRDDVAAMENGDRDDFQYGDELAYPPAKVDRILRDGDTVQLGEVLLTAYHTPGHTRGATTWVANLVIDGRATGVVFPDGAGFNDGYRLLKNPSYPGIGDDFRRTHHRLEMLKPDIWLAPHNERCDFEGKRQRARTEGVRAWIDPEGYRRFVAGRKRAFEDAIDAEMGAPGKAESRPAADGGGGSPAPPAIERHP